jgi:hypothetical protein
MNQRLDKHTWFAGTVTLKLYGLENIHTPFHVIAVIRRMRVSLCIREWDTVP